MSIFSLEYMHKKKHQNSGTCIIKLSYSTIMQSFSLMRTYHFSLNCLTLLWSWNRSRSLKIVWTGKAHWVLSLKIWHLPHLSSQQKFTSLKFLTCLGTQPPKKMLITSLKYTSESLTKHNMHDLLQVCSTKTMFTLNKDLKKKKSLTVYVSDKPATLKQDLSHQSGMKW